MSEQINLEVLHKHLVDLFNETEQRTLCFALKINYDALPGSGTSAKATSLIEYCQRHQSLDNLAKAIRRARPHLPESALELDSQIEPPFKGLLAFNESDANIFYGRSKLIEELYQRLIEKEKYDDSPTLAQNQSANFLALVGASGTGKSSVVRAGLIPTIRRKTNWSIHLITPTAKPIESLATTLTRDSESLTATTTLMDDLFQDKRSLHLYIQKKAQLHATGKALSNEHVLIVIDQFEELFTLCKSEEARQAFIENLIYAIHPESTSGLLTIVITIRADFYNACLEYPEIHSFLERYQKIIPMMSSDELREAIESPASNVGVSFEDGLVDLILHDLGAIHSRSTEPGALPLLSHVLLELWYRQEGNRLTLSGYHKAGRVTGAIAQSAEVTFEKLGSYRQRVAKNFFITLTELGKNTQDTRRRVQIDDLIQEEDQTRTELAFETLEILTSARLITVSQDFAEVSHEALIRNWPRLNRWLNKNREELLLHRQLSNACALWVEYNYDESVLLRGLHLKKFVNWANEHQSELSSIEKSFLEASVNNDQAFKNLEKQLKQLRETRENVPPLPVLDKTDIQSNLWWDNIEGDAVNIRNSVSLLKQDVDKYLGDKKAANLIKAKLDIVFNLANQILEANTNNEQEYNDKLESLEMALEELRGIKGVVGARSALAWMGMASNAWRHNIEGNAVNIRNTASLLKLEATRLINDAESLDTLNARLDLIHQLANQILERPITPPLSSESGVELVVVNYLLREHTIQFWKDGKYEGLAEPIFNLEPTENILVWASSEWLRRALDLVLDNAGDAMITTPKKQLTINTAIADDDLHIFIQDTGDGIPDDVLKQLFTGETTLPKREGHLGRGLLMVQAIMETYGGDVSIAKTSANGTTVLLRLPIAQDK